MNEKSVPHLWKCDKCDKFCVFNDKDELGSFPIHEDCGGYWRVVPTLKAQVIDTTTVS